MSFFDDVGDFHRKFGLPFAGDGAPPAFMDKDAGAFRRKFLAEELHEFDDACADNDLAAAADALADLIYVALGTAQMMHLPFDQVWGEVQRANMSKERAAGAADPRSTRGHALDVVKPAGFRPPDHDPALRRAAAVAQNGWKTETDWDFRFLELARHVARWSKDPSTKVGAVLVARNRNKIAHGYNGFPRGIADTPERLADRATKYRLVQHAERNVLDNAAFDTYGATLYSTMFPCSECAKSIVSKGVARVVAPFPHQGDRWFDEAGWGLRILDEAGVKVS